MDYILFDLTNLLKSVLINKIMYRKNTTKIWIVELGEVFLFLNGKNSEQRALQCVSEYKLSAPMHQTGITVWFIFSSSTTLKRVFTKNRLLPQLHSQKLKKNITKTRKKKCKRDWNRASDRPSSWISTNMQVYHKPAFQPISIHSSSAIYEKKMEDW